MKKLISSILCVVMLAVNMVGEVSFAASDIIFYKDDTKVYFNDEFVDMLNGEGITPTVVNGVFYAPLRPFVELQNGSIVWKSNGEKVEANFAIGSYYTVEQDSNKIVKYDGSENELKAQVFLNQNYERLMVPADTFEMLGYKIIQGDNYLGVFSLSNEEDVIGVSFDNESIINEATIKYSLLNDEGYVYAEDISSTGDIINTTVGNLGSSIDVSVDGGSVNEATITFTYDENNLGDISESNLKIVWYNELLGRMEILDNSVVDEENNTVSVSTSHFSKYSVVDSTEWYEAWAKSQLIKRDTSMGNGHYNVTFLLDTSGSMDNSIGLLKNTVTDFIDNLYDDDIISLITFSNGAEKLIDSKLKQNVDYTRVINNLRASGGTDMLAGLDICNEIEILDSNPTEEEQYISSLKASATKVVIMLSDGQPDSSNNRDDIISQCKLAASGSRFVSVALGSGADTDLMKKIAGETEGLYKYIDKPSDLSDMFMQISGEVIGLEQDTDGDGIPDLIETTGMRDQAGNIFTTDPNNADTDGDMISDGDEMGVFINENGGYFIRESNPNIPTTYDSAAEIYDSSVSATFVDYDGKFKIRLNLRFLSDEIVEKSVFSASGMQVSNSAIEIIHASAQNLKIEKTALPDCIETNVTTYEAPVAKAGESYNYTMEAKCKNGGLYCEDIHTMTFTISGDNMDPVVVNGTIDLENMMLSEATKDINGIQKELHTQIKRKTTDYMTKATREKKEHQDELSDIITFNEGNDNPEDVKKAIKSVIVNVIAEENGVESISINPIDMVKDCYAFIGIRNGEKYPVKVGNVDYIVEISGFTPTVKGLFDKYTLVDISGKCYKKNTPAEKYNFWYVTQNKQEIERFLDAYDKIMDDLKDDAKNEMDKQTKAMLKAIIKASMPDLLNAVNKLEENSLKEVGIFDEVQMYKTGLDVLKKVSSSTGFSPEDAVSTCKAYKDLGSKSSIISDWSLGKLTDLIALLAK